MKAYQIGAQDNIDALVATTRPDPVAGPGEALVAPRLVGLISRDVQLLRGTYGPRQPETRIPMSEGVGEVVAIGEGVTEVAIGDRVVCGHFASWLDGAFRSDVFAHDIGITHDGWLAERIVLPAAALIRVPDALADVDVAGLASAALTAWNALVEICHVKAGDTVLCLGTGSVSLAALKIAKARGARVAITSSHDAKLETARALGADIAVNYRTSPDWAAEVIAQTEGKGADIVIETGGVDTLGQSIAATAANARIVVVGVSPGEGPAITDYLSLIIKNVTIRGIANGSRAIRRSTRRDGGGRHDDGRRPDLRIRRRTGRRPLLLRCRPIRQGDDRILTERARWRANAGASVPCPFDRARPCRRGSAGSRVSPCVLAI